ncbi:MAG TPA: twin-arginine translocase TatA/TatE family subunit [Candidatus Saccharimonadales bacterium]|nr:twin-arginine translocase TatA/TatE family subunit [Candidatus Saccharimonadales bacterium]
MPDLLLILIVILILVVVWRGPKTLPKIGEALGRGVREAKTEAGKAQAEIQKRGWDEPAAATDVSATSAQPAAATPSVAAAAPAAPGAPAAAPTAPAASDPAATDRPA